MAKKQGKSKKAEKTPDVPAKVTFSYIKSQHHRVVYANGAVGGPSPRGDELVLSFFNERAPIPREVTHKVNRDGSLGPELRDARVSRNGIVREVEATVRMDLAAAESLRDWLTRHIVSLRQMQEKISAAKLAARKNVATRKKARK